MIDSLYKLKDNYKVVLVQVKTITDILFMQSLVDTCLGDEKIHALFCHQYHY